METSLLPWKNLCFQSYFCKLSVACLLYTSLEIGRQIVELSAPHIYDLTGKLTPGRHTLTLRLDNRDLLSLGDMASGYSPDTQDYWIGVAGRIELQIRPQCHVADVQVYPAADSVRVRIVTACNVHSPERQDCGTLRRCV